MIDGHPNLWRDTGGVWQSQSHLNGLHGRLVVGSDEIVRILRDIAFIRQVARPIGLDVPEQAIGR